MKTGGIINNYYAFIFILTLFYGAVFCFSGFVGTPFGSFKDLIMLVLQWGVVLFATYGLLMVISVCKYVFSVAFPLLTTLCTILAYFSYTANVQLTPMLIDLTFVNDARTWMGVIDFWLVAVTVISFVLSVIVASYRFRHIKSGFYESILNLIIGILIILITNIWVSKFVNPVAERLPYNIFHSFLRYYNDKKVALEERNTFTVMPHTDVDSLNVVLVIGESLRSDHLQMNGYHRETTPLLMQDSCISLPNVYTEPCYTHLSVPHMLTRADSVNTGRAFTEQSFVTIFKQAGYRTAWISNQDQADTYVYFMNECDTLIYANSGKSLYIIDKWLDSDILPAYKKLLGEKADKKLILMHTIGSHWYYTTHFYEETSKFKPNIKSKIVSSNTKEEMINSYDNTIVETDRFIHQIIDGLRGSDAVLIYLSDHGESLGEDGYFLHGTDRPELHYPACFVWFSDGYKKKYPAKVDALKRNARRRLRTDFLFHSIIGAASIESVYKEESLDIFK